LQARDFLGVRLSFAGGDWLALGQTLDNPVVVVAFDHDAVDAMLDVVAPEHYTDASEDEAGTESKGHPDPLAKLAPHGCRPVPRM
jgi:hypothetical protein